jgi:hypothetical protein
VRSTPWNVIGLDLKRHVPTRSSAFTAALLSKMIQELQHTADGTEA